MEYLWSWGSTMVQHNNYRVASSILSLDNSRSCFFACFSSVYISFNYQKEHASRWILIVPLMLPD